MAQIVYYVAAAVALGAPERAVSLRRADRQFRQCLCRPCRAPHGPADRASSSSAPTATTSWRASSMTARMTIGAVEPSLSPSMDIQVSSNFERLLFELTGRDGARVAARDDRVPPRTARLPASRAEWQQRRSALRRASRRRPRHPRRRSPRPTAPPASCSIRTAPSRSPPPRPSARDRDAADGGARHARIRRSSPMRSSAPRASARHCRRGSPSS